MSKCKYCDKNHEGENTGCDNSGNWNTGHWNSGNCNSGDWNSGNCNSGNCNSGDWNSGDWNSGNRNSGNWNSGDWNSGDWNSGNWNSGNRNSGNWNSGNWNSGYFNTRSPNKIMVFNKWIKMTNKEFEDKYNIYADIPLNRWVGKENMSDEEKKGVQGWEQMGGYLKTLDFKEACKIWWQENPKRHKDFLELPGFEWSIFTEITGIEQDTPSLSGKKVSVLIDGLKYSATID